MGLLDETAFGFTGLFGLVDKKKKKKRKKKKPHMWGLSDSDMRHAEKFNVAKLNKVNRQILPMYTDKEGGYWKLWPRNCKIEQGLLHLIRFCHTAQGASEDYIVWQMQGRRLPIHIHAVRIPKVGVWDCINDLRH